jgi:hypothetical protein
MHASWLQRLGVVNEAGWEAEILTLSSELLKRESTAKWIGDRLKEYRDFAVW